MHFKQDALLKLRTTKSNSGKSDNTIAKRRSRPTLSMVGEMVQNSQSLYSFTFTAVIVIPEYIYSHSTTKFTFKKYICLHLTTYFLFTNIFTHIYGMYHSHSPAYIRSHSRSPYSFNAVQYSFNIFFALPLRIIRSQLPLFLNANGRRRKS